MDRGPLLPVVVVVDVVDMDMVITSLQVGWGRLDSGRSGTLWNEEVVRLVAFLIKQRSDLLTATTTLVDDSGEGWCSR